MKLRTFLVETPVLFLVIFILIGTGMLSFHNYSKNNRDRSITINIQDNIDDESLNTTSITFDEEITGIPENIRNLIISMQNGSDESYETLLKEHGDIDEVKLALVSELIKRDNHEGAIELIKKIDRSNKTLNARVLLREGLIYDDSSKYYEALEILPNSYLGNYNLGTKLLREKEYYDSVKYLTKASKISGNDNKAKSLFNLGISYSKLNSFEEAIKSYNEVIRLQPGNIKARRNLAIVYKNLGNKNKYLEYLETVIKLDTHIPTLIDLSNYYLEEGNLNLSFQYLDMGYKSYPMNSNILEELGNYYLKLEESEIATEYFRKIVQGKDDSVTARFNLGKHYYSINNYTVSIEHYLRAVEISENSHIESLNNLGLVSKEIGNNDDAIFYYSKAIELNPEYTNGFYNLGLLYLSIENYELAFTNFNKAKSLSPSDGKTWYNLGITNSKLGEDRLAIDSYKKSLEFTPNNDKARINLGNIYRKFGNYELAEKEYKTASKINSDNWISWYNLALTQKDLGKFDESIESFKKSIEINSNNLNSYKGLISLFRKNEQYSDALNAVNSGLLIFTSESSLYYLKALIKNDLGEYEKSISTLQKVVSLDNNYEKAHLLLGNHYFDLKQYDNSIVSYKNALNINPEPRTYYNLGKSYYRNNQYNESVDAYKNAESDMKNYPWLYYHLGKSYLKLNNVNLAEESFNRSIKLSPDFEERVINLSLKDEDSSEILEELLKDNPDNINILESYISDFMENNTDSDVLLKLDEYRANIEESSKLLNLYGILSFNEEKYDLSAKYLTKRLHKSPVDFANVDILLKALEKVGKEESIIELLLPYNKSNKSFNTIIADIYYDNKNYESALKYYSLTDDLESIGKTYYRLKNYEKAYEYYNSDKIEDTKWNKIWLARSLYKLNKEAKAIELYKEIISGYPNFIQGYIGLGDIYEDQNSVKDALEMYNRALEIDPDHNSVRKKINKLK